MTINQPKTRIIPAITTSLIGAFTYVILTSEAKVTLANYSFNQIAFVRSLVSLILTLIAIGFVKKKESFPSFLKTKNLLTHAIRGLSGLATFYLILFSIKTISITESNLLFNTCPIFIPFVSYFWKKKKIDSNIWPGIISAFLGIFLILHPSTNQYNIGLWLALLGGLFCAISVTALRFSYYTEPLTRSLFYYTLISTVATSILCLIEGFPVELFTSMSAFLPCLKTGALGFSSLFFTSLSFKFAPAKFISPFSYSTILFGLVLDYIFWNQIPTPLEFSGISLVLLGLFLMIFLLRPKKTSFAELPPLSD
jgi:drug/metabolite transporter (DMT)-like permease